tara:strand:- start:194 stop:688 length:495 start_codon:yes stop_codon:yes gene_type:complete
MLEHPSTPTPAINRGDRNLADIFERNEICKTFRISYLANRLVIPVYEYIKREFGLNWGEYLLLFCLSNIKELTAQDVADMTGRPRNSISRAVHRMLDDGYLTRSPDPADGRQALLRITPKGQELHGQIVPRFIARQEQILGSLDGDELRKLDRLLAKLVGSNAP